MDVFASKENTRCPEFWDEGVDAFTQPWKQGRALWINPPFSRLPEVVDKIATEGVRCFLVCPNWPTQKWFALAHEKMTQAYFFPAGSRIFETAEGPSGPTHWGVWVLYFKGDTTEGAIRRIVGAPRGESHLRVGIRLVADECDAVTSCEGLVDSGAEACIIRKGLIPSQFFYPAERPLRLVGASNQRMEGGDKEVVLKVCITGTHTLTQQKVELCVPTIFYESNIKEDVILSYDWCANTGVEVHAPKHGILCVRKGTEIWVDGVKTFSTEDPGTQVRVVTHQPPKRALDLFSGTGSTTRVLESAGSDVVSVDIDPRYRPTICGNILDWRYWE